MNHDSNERLGLARKRRFTPPRKVILGSVIHDYTKGPDCMEAHLELALQHIRWLTQLAQGKYTGRGCDLIVLPECAIRTGAKDKTAAAQAVELNGPVLDTLSSAARDARSNLVIPMIRATDRERGIFHNTAVVINRDGNLVGTYDKYHTVVPNGSDVIERGMTPGHGFPVFDLDFGRIGIQICIDIGFADGWEALTRQGAELVAWPSMNPTMVMPAIRAEQNRYYVLGSQNRYNATLFEPNGQVGAQVLDPDKYLVHEIDLSWMLIPWSFELRNGDAFTEAFPGQAGHHYDTGEDNGLFWSNNPDLPIGEMASRLGIEELDEWYARNIRLTDAARSAGASKQ